MCRLGLAPVLLAFVPLVARGGDAVEKADYREFSKLVHDLVAKRVPKEVEDVTGWGMTIPVPDKLRFPNLKRTFVKVGARLEVPNGAWRRFKAKIDDPDRDLKIRVRDFKQLDPANYRLVLDADARILCAGEWQQWVNGIRLLDTTGSAEVDFAISVVCDAAVSFDFKVFPPKIDVEPKIKDLGVDLRDLHFRRIDNNILGGNLAQTQQVQQLTPRLRDLLHDAVKANEPLIKDYANEAIARALRENRGSISAAAIMKVLPKTPEKK